MDGSKILEDDQKSKHSKMNQSKSGNDDGSGSEDKDGDDDDEEEEVLINEEEMRKLKAAFQKLQKNKKITVEQALIIVKNVTDDVMFHEEKIYDILQDEEVEQTRKMTEKNFIELIETIKKIQNQQNEADTLLAYVAMGGNQDRGGFIDAAKLIQIIKNDFEMTIDIEKLIQDVDDDGSGEIEYVEFNTLLNGD